MNRNIEKLLQSGVQAQREKLEENNHKKGFENVEILYAFLRIGEEVQELKEELFIEGPYSLLIQPKDEFDLDYDAIRKECADIANFCHMLIYRCNQELKE